MSITLLAKVGQFEPVDANIFSMDEAREHFAPIFQELYRAAGNPQTDREKLFFLKGLLHGWRFSEKRPDKTQAEHENFELATQEYLMLCHAGYII